MHNHQINSQEWASCYPLEMYSFWNENYKSDISPDHSRESDKMRHGMYKIDNLKTGEKIKKGI